MDVVDSYLARVQKKVKFSAKPGDTVNVHTRFQEGKKERTQVFRGVLIKVQGVKDTKSFTVRKMSGGVGVEKSFPLASPAVQKVEVLSSAKVRRSKLFYLRGLKGRKSRLQTLTGVQEAAESAKELEKTKSAKPAKEEQKAKAKTPEPVKKAKTPGAK